MPKPHVIVRSASDEDFDGELRVDPECVEWNAFWPNDPERYAEEYEFGDRSMARNSGLTLRFEPKGDGRTVLTDDDALSGALLERFQKNLKTATKTTQLDLRDWARESGWHFQPGQLLLVTEGCVRKILVVRGVLHELKPERRTTYLLRDRIDPSGRGRLTIGANPDLDKQGNLVSESGVLARLATEGEIEEAEALADALERLRIQDTVTVSCGGQKEEGCLVQVIPRGLDTRIFVHGFNSESTHRIDGSSLVSGKHRLDRERTTRARNRRNEKVVLHVDGPKNR